MEALIRPPGWALDQSTLVKTVVRQFLRPRIPPTSAKVTTELRRTWTYSFNRRWAWRARQVSHLPILNNTRRPEFMVCATLPRVPSFSLRSLRSVTFVERNRNRQSIPLVPDNLLENAPYLRHSCLSPDLSLLSDGPFPSSYLACTMSFSSHRLPHSPTWTLFVSPVNFPNSFILLDLH